MKFDLSQIEYSYNDLKRGIKLPTQTTEDLAEFIGILMGDGHIGFREGPGFKHYEIRLSGHWIDDQLYVTKIINKIFKNLFNTTFLVSHRKDKGYSLKARRDSKSILQFLHKNNNLVLGSKDQFRKLPKWIKSSNKYKTAFLRGIADTDFSLTFKRKYTRPHHDYPVIQAKFKPNSKTNS